MGKKVELKKIENLTKSQVTFSNRRTGLLKKVRETSGSCDVDVALLIFLPSGRISKLCNQNRTEDLLGRYNNLPAEKRYPQIKNTEEKVEKLKLFDHIQGDENKLHFLNNQIKQMEQRIRKATLESDLLDTCLTDYEPDPACDTSLVQLLWCERELKHSLQQVTERKRMLLANLPPSNEQLRIEKKQKEMERMLANLASSSEQLKILQKEQKEMERMLLANLASSKEQLRIQKEMARKALSAKISHDLGGNEVDWGTPHPYATNLLMQLDPWLSPHRPKVRQALLQELSSQQKELFAVDNGVKLFNYTKHAPTQVCRQTGICIQMRNWESWMSQKTWEDLGTYDVPLVTQPQHIPAQTMTQNRNYPTGYNGNIAPMSRLYGNGTNYNLNSSIRGYYNTNLNNWNQNSTANNMINSSIGGNNYKTTIDNWNQDSIANINAPITSSERINNVMEDKNSRCDTNENHIEVPNINNWNQIPIANNQVNSSISGNNSKANFCNWNLNSIANNRVNSSTSGNNYNTNYINNWNQNSIANNIAPISSESCVTRKSYYSINNAMINKSSGFDHTNEKLTEVLPSINDWNHNITANNHVNLSSRGNNYHNNTNRWNRDSIAYNIAAISSESSINYDMNDKSSGSGTNEKHLQVLNKFSHEVTKGNDTLMSTEGSKEVGPWESWDGFALAENLNSEDIDIFF